MANSFSESVQDEIDAALTIIQRRLDSRSKRQEELVEAREELLVERQAVRSHLQKVNKHRASTRNAEVKLMNAFRKVLNDLGSDVPEDLKQAYATVRNAHDTLGSMEEDYLHNEEALGGREWEFIDRESDFYHVDENADLLRDVRNDNGWASRIEQNPPTSQLEPSKPPNIDTYGAAIIEHDQLTAQFNEFRRDRARSFDRQMNQSFDLQGLATWIDPLKIPDLSQAQSALLDQMMDCEVRIHHLKWDTPYQQPHTRKIDLDEWTSVRGSSTIEPVAGNMHVAATNMIPEQAPVLFASATVEEWCWGIVQSVALERRMFFNILMSRGISSEGAFDLGPYSTRDAFMNMHGKTEILFHGPLPTRDKLHHVTVAHPSIGQLDRDDDLSEFGTLKPETDPGIWVDNTSPLEPTIPSRGDIDLSLASNAVESVLQLPSSKATRSKYGDSLPQAKRVFEMSQNQIHDNRPTSGAEEHRQDSPLQSDQPTYRRVDDTQKQTCAAVPKFDDGFGTHNRSNIRQISVKAGGGIDSTAGPEDAPFEVQPGHRKGLPQPPDPLRRARDARSEAFTERTPRSRAASAFHEQRKFIRSYPSYCPFTMGSQENLVMNHAQHTPLTQ